MSATTKELILFLLCSLLLQVVALRAETPQPQPQSLEFSLLLIKPVQVYVGSGAKENRPQFYFQGADGWERVLPTPGQLSQRYRYVGPSPLQIFDRDPQGLSELPTPVASLELGSEQASQVLVLLPGSGGAYELYALERSLPSEKRGLEILNMSASDLRFVADEASFTLGGGSSKSHVLDPEQTRYLRLTAYEDAQSQQAVLSTKVRLHRAGHQMLLLYPSKEKSSTNWLLKSILLPE